MPRHPPPPDTAHDRELFDAALEAALSKGGRLPTKGAARTKPQPVPEPPLDAGPTMGLAEVGRGQCRWPYPGLLVCGRPTTGKSSYCPTHGAPLTVASLKTRIKVPRGA